LINRKLASHLGKWDGLFARLCVIWHCIENFRVHPLPNIVESHTASRVAEVMERYLLPHLISFYTNVLGVSDDQDDLEAIAGLILAKGLMTITNRDVARSVRSLRKLTKVNVEQYFEQLVAFGWLYESQDDKKPYKKRWDVNPQVHLLYRARAVTERNRRDQAHDAIVKMFGA